MLMKLYHSCRKEVFCNYCDDNISVETLQTLISISFLIAVEKLDSGKSKSSMSPLNRYK